MRVLVTGANGRIGRIVVPYLLNGGHKVTIATRRVESCGPTSIQLDLTQPIEADAIANIDGVVHLGGLSDRRAHDEDDFFQVNHLGTMALARAAADAGVKCFVFASSILVHGDSAVVGLTAQSALAPQDAYARAKAATEAELFAARDLKAMSVVNLRLAPLVTPPDPPPMIEGLVRRLPILPAPWPDNQRCTMSAVAVAEAVMSALGYCGGPTARLSMLVADGQAGFRSQLTKEVERTSARRLILPLPHLVWSWLDAIFKRFGKPSLAGAYTDLRVASLRDISCD